MSFFSDALRVAGFIVAPVLAATGVGLPLAIGIGAVAAGAGNAGADTVERNNQNNAANERAEAERRAADARIEQQRQDAIARQRQVEAELNRQQQQAQLPQEIIRSCQAGTVGQLPNLLQRLTNEQFRGLGLNPIAACTTAETRQQVTEMIQAEQRRRFG